MTAPDWFHTACAEVFGEFVSPSKVDALYERVRPVFGGEAADLAFRAQASDPDYCPDPEVWGQGHDDHAEASAATICKAFGVRHD